MNGSQQNDLKRQGLLERLLDAVKQCQIRFGGRKEIASDSDSRVICLCAQFEAVLQHGLRRTRGLALTAAAIKQAAGFTSKTEAELSFWFHVKEHLNRHELQRFYSLRHITSELGRGRAWLRAALNEHSLERYLHTVLADRTRLSTFYEDWAFVMDEERASMLPTMAAGLNSILFAINIDNYDLNGQSRGPGGGGVGGVAGVGSAAVSNLLKESTQGMSSLWKESTQGVSSLLREIGSATAVVPGFAPRADGASDPLPVMPRSTSADSGLRKERRRKKKVTNIISFDDDDDHDTEEQPYEGIRSPRKGLVVTTPISTLTSTLTATPTPTAPVPIGRPSPEDEEEEEDGVGGEEAEDGGVPRPSLDTLEVLDAQEALDPSPSQNGLLEPGIVGWATTPPAAHNGAPPPSLLDTKSIDNEEEDDEDEDVYGKGRTAQLQQETASTDQMVVGSLSSVSTWSPRQQILTENDNDSSDIFIPLAPSEVYTQPVGSVETTGYVPRSSSIATDMEKPLSQLQFSMEPSPPVSSAPVSSTLPTPGLPDAMTVVELRQAIVAMMNRKDELSEQNTSLRSLLDGEMEHSAGLRQEVDTLKTKLAELEERHAAKVQALGRENEVLKVQLKKYVGAVQMLKREGNQGNDAMHNCEAPLPAPVYRATADVEELASNYERKLIEVAEMHGELIEFNERLYRSLMAKDHLITQMRQELIDLRGPMPGDLSQTSDDPSLSDFETTNRALVNVWIPSVFLQGRAANAYHVYQVYIRIKDNEWNVYRRYTEFRELHTHLRIQFPQVDSFHFPPKKAIGNKDAKFVEERRKQLQTYLRMVMNKLVQTLPDFTTQPTKETLLRLVPFCQDTPKTTDGGSKTARSKASSRFPRLGRNQNRDSRNPEPQSGDL
ncbi:sorting nexin-29 [Engraulis encrasicolus]|uniref:sorting nexin-29 n=1 Tax=Engraulis encrasicolus TaxID=184585 RepID=UPI002FD077FA